LIGTETQYLISCVAAGRKIAAAKEYRRDRFIADTREARRTWW
jgi:hypothetical protein